VIDRLINEVQCDQLLPSCSQCRKAGWVCPQYADSVERMFQYQDLNHFKKTEKAAGACREVQVPKQSTVKSSSPNDTAQRDDISSNGLPKEITQSVDGRAIDYFLLTHTFREDGRIRGFFEYLLACDDLRTNKEVSISLRASALAAYANKFRHCEILKEARHYYGYALRLVNRALQSRGDAAKTSTMVSILLLNAFQTLTDEGRTSLAHSDGHMRGAMTIMNLRGQSLMDSRQGLQVFLHICRCLITYW
jgi:hypothetical protein